MSVSAVISAGFSRGTPSMRYVWGAWVLAAIAVLGQGAVVEVLGRGTVTAEFLLRWRLLPVGLWAGVTPVVLAAARRWPVPAARWPAHVAVHLVLFFAWMLLSNLLLRVPELTGPGAAGLGAVGGASVWAAFEYGPAGALLWAGLVAVGSGPDAVGSGAAVGTATRGRGARTPAGSRADRAATGGRRDRGVARGAEPLALREGYRTHRVPREAVRWVEADGDYLRVHTAERSYRIRGPMKAFLRRLDDERFLRIHRSTLVNVDFVREVQPYFHGDWMAILRDGTELRVPRTRRAAIGRLRGRPRS